MLKCLIEMVPQRVLLLLLILGLVACAQQDVTPTVEFGLPTATASAVVETPKSVPPIGTPTLSPTETLIPESTTPSLAPTITKTKLPPSATLTPTPEYDPYAPPVLVRDRMLVSGIVYKSELIEARSFSRHGQEVRSGIWQERITNNMRSQMFKGFIVEAPIEREDGYWEIMVVVPRDTDGKPVTFKLINPGAGITGGVIFGFAFRGTYQEGVWILGPEGVYYYGETLLLGANMARYLQPGRPLEFNANWFNISQLPAWATEDFCAPICQRRFGSAMDPRANQQIDIALQVLKGDIPIPDDPIEIPSAHRLLVGVPKSEEEETLPELIHIPHYLRPIIP